MKFRFLITVFLAALVASLSTSCSVDKYVAPSDKLLKSNVYEVTMADGGETPKEIEEVLENMKSYTMQTPNKRLLGTVRLAMRLYCLSNPDNNNFWNRYLRREGEAPVVYDENATIYTTQQLKGLMESKGCFHSKVTADTTHLRNHDIQVTYHLYPSTRYQIEEFSTFAETPEIKLLLDKNNGSSFLKVGDYYDQDKISQERDRVVELLQNEGYYLANNELVRFLVDTTYSSGQLSVEMTILNPTMQRPGQEQQRVSLKKYHIDKIYLYPDGNNVISALEAFDTLAYTFTSRGMSTDYTFIYDGEMALKPKTIARNMFLFHNQTYRPINLTRTYNSLLTLKNFKYIDLSVSESPNSTDSLPLLDARVKLKNSTRQKVSASLELTNSSSFGNLEAGNALTSGNFGLEGVLSYENKNLFGGAEILKTEGSLLFELPKIILHNGMDGEFHDNVTAFEIGLDMNLDIPNFLLPFTTNISWQQAKPHTVFNLGGSYQYRYYFERILANTSMGYSWSKNRQIHNQLLPIELTYVRFIDLDEDFLDRIAGTTDPRLKYQYSDHFIMDARYDFIYNTQQFNTRKDFSYLRISLESAGNLLQGFCNLTHRPADENGIRSLFGVPFSQYLRFNGEFKHYFYLGKKRTFVARMLAGIGLPYHNSSAMPYEKSFYGGGPTTMRAWQLRYLGPGNFVSDENQMFERVGDMTLVLNLEERFPIFGILEGAIFADMGNVWLINNSEEWAGGEFRWDSFPESIALGAGLGLRLNISILTVRADFGIPVYDPGYTANQRWRPAHWKFNQIVTNFGIDYPF